MKKSKLSIGLVTSFIGALALSACNEATSPVKEKKDLLVDFVGYDSSKDRIEVKTDLYDELGDSNESTKNYYNAILEVLIRSQYEKLSTDSKYSKDLLSYAVVESEAVNGVKKLKQTAEDEARKSGTSFESEWQKILDEKGCEDEADLKEFLIYDTEKTQLTNAYNKENVGELTTEYLGIKPGATKEDPWVEVPAEERKIDSLSPYHILHILVKFDSAKDDYIRGTISTDTAKKLWIVVSKLINKQYSFQDISGSKDNNDSSETEYGDVEIMSTQTSFFNEFKLGMYAYDAILSGVNDYKNRDTYYPELYKTLGFSKEEKVTKEIKGQQKEVYADAEIITESGKTQKKENIFDMIQTEMVDRVKTPVSDETPFKMIPAIPYGVFKELGRLAEDEKIELDNYNFVNKFGANSYPRNVLFNQFLNFHSPFIIVDDDIKWNATTDKIETEQHIFTGEVDDNFSATALKEYTELTGKKVLTDREGNVVIGVRSEAGIHFMIMRKSVFYETNKRVGKHTTSLQDYYTTKLPSEEGYPAGGETYVNLKQNEPESYYQTRIDSMKNKELFTTSLDAALDYRLYEELVALCGDKLVFKNPKIKTNIENLISKLRENQHISEVDSINSSWTSYLMMLRGQNDIRNNYTDSMVPATCAYKFGKKNMTAEERKEFEEGGKCYVA